LAGRVQDGCAVGHFRFKTVYFYFWHMPSLFNFFKSVIV
jgi:hypothetical protein